MGLGILDCTNQCTIVVVEISTVVDQCGEGSNQKLDPKAWVCLAHKCSSRGIDCTPLAVESPGKNYGNIV